jgi:hypothetical protein
MALDQDWCLMSVVGVLESAAGGKGFEIEMS